MDVNGSFGNMGGTGSSMSNVSSSPVSAQTGEYNKKRSYGSFNGGWLAFAGVTIAIILLIILGNV